jgi:hypothetical protein
MAEHPVRRVLRRDLLPYLVTARRLPKQWFYLLHVLFGYTTDLVVVLSAVGVSAPLLGMLGPLDQTGRGAPSPSLPAALQSVPGLVMIPTAAILVFWLALRVTYNREDGQKRALLAKSCRRQLRKAEASLPAILSTPDPMPEIAKLLEKGIRNPVDQYISDEAWPWLPFAPGIDAEVDRELEAWCSKYESDWTPITTPALQQRV